MAEANGCETEWEKFCKEQAESFDRFSALQRSGIAGVFEIEGKKFIRKARLSGFDEGVDIVANGEGFSDEDYQKITEKRRELESEGT